MSVRQAFMLGVAFIIILASCAPREEPKLRPVRTEESDQPLRSEPTEYTITAEGKVTDKVNGKEIPNARVMVVTIAGTCRFEGSTFEVSFPAMSAVNIRAKPQATSRLQGKSKPTTSAPPHSRSRYGWSR